MHSGKKRSLSEARSTDDSGKTKHGVLVKPVRERKRQLVKVVMYLRSGFRHSFGIGVSNKHGHFLDYHLSRAVLGFADWVAYPKGDRVLHLEPNDVNSVFVSEDGHNLFVGCYDGSIMVLNLVDHTKVEHWDAHSSRICCLIGRCGILVSAGYCSGMKMWDSHTHQLLRTIEKTNGLVTCLDINAKGNLVISGHYNGSLLLWSVQSGRCLKKFSNHRIEICSVLFSKMGIISGCYSNSKYLWHVSLDSPAQSIAVSNTNHKLFQILINCDESMIALVHSKKVIIHSWPELNLIRKIGVSERTVCCFHPCRSHLLAYYSPYSVHIRNVIDGAMRTLYRSGEISSSLHFTPDGSHLIFASYPKVVILDVIHELPYL